LRTAVPFPCGVLGGSPEYLPHGRTQAGDRHLKFYETRDNLVADDAHRPLESYRVTELAQMKEDIFDDAHNFAALRRAFLTKRPAPRLPAMRAG
jgi:hypothetical protein